MYLEDIPKTMEEGEDRWRTSGEISKFKYKYISDKHYIIDKQTLHCRLLFTVTLISHYLL